MAQKSTPYCLGGGILLWGMNGTPPKNGWVPSISTALKKRLGHENRKERRGVTPVCDVGVDDGVQTGGPSTQWRSSHRHPQIAARNPFPRVFGVKYHPCWGRRVSKEKHGRCTDSPWGNLREGGQMCSLGTPPPASQRWGRRWRPRGRGAPCWPGGRTPAGPRTSHPW